MSEQMDPPEWAVPGAKALIITGSRDRMIVEATVKRVGKRYVVVTDHRGRERAFDFWRARQDDGLPERGARRYPSSDLVAADSARGREALAAAAVDAARRRVLAIADDFRRDSQSHDRQDRLDAAQALMAAAREYVEAHGADLGSGR